ncbi:RNA polymerase sigma factor [Streptomyces sp. NPDC058457]|uniref:RNA polymerase sigma factor n=1 Tax=Streptomyces sp. NPDC058457 TaxID=3346507 RepID=UPI00364A8207
MTEEESRQRRRARFEGLAHVVVEPLYRYLLRRTSADMVDDVLAEAMLVLWRRVDEVPGLGPTSGSLGPTSGSLPPDPDDVLPWCYGVARGCLANARRADGRRLRLVERLVRTQERQSAEGADHSDLHTALAALGALDREVVRLWAWEGLAPRQIAEATGLTSNAVSIRLHRAKKKLAEQLVRKHDEPSGHKRDEGRSGQ